MTRGRAINLTKPQEDMLAMLAASTFGELFIRGHRRVTAKTLVTKGLMCRQIGQGWYGITAAGRQRVLRIGDNK